MIVRLPFPAKLFVSLAGNHAMCKVKFSALLRLWGFRLYLDIS